MTSKHKDNEEISKGDTGQKSKNAFLCKEKLKFCHKFNKSSMQSIILLIQTNEQNGKLKSKCLNDLKEHFTEKKHK